MQTHQNACLAGTGRKLSAVILTIIISTFMAGTAWACHKGVPHGKETSCTSELPEAPDNVALWGVSEFGSGIFEHDETVRTCVLARVAADLSDGSYSCDMNAAHIHYDLSLMQAEVAHRRGDDWRCLNPNSLYIDPDLEYSYSWSGDCASEAGCNVTIVNRFSNCGSIGGSVGRVTLEAFASGVHAVEGDFNPFASDQDIEIDYLHLTLFSAKVAKKVLAVCKLTPHENQPVTFHTAVVTP